MVFMDFLVTHNIKRDMESNEDFKIIIYSFIKKFYANNWGDLTEDDKQLNKEAITNNRGHILASYTIPEELQCGKDEKVWIIQYIGENLSKEEKTPVILYPSEY
jgi:hypothetical protein